MNQCLACSASFRRMCTYREHLGTEHGCHFPANNVIPMNWYRVATAPNKAYRDPAPFRFQPITRLPDDACRGISRQDWRTGISTSALEEEMQLFAAQTQAPSVMPLPLFPGSPVQYREADMQVKRPPVPSPRVQSVRSLETVAKTAAPRESRLVLLRQGKTQPPTAESVRFAKGPDMVEQAFEMAADVSRHAKAMRSYAETLLERHDGWMRLDLERKSLEAQLATGKEDAQRQERKMIELEAQLTSEREEGQRQVAELGDSLRASQVERQLREVERNAALHEATQRRNEVQAGSVLAEEQRAKITSLEDQNKELLAELTALRDINQELRQELLD